MPDFSQYLPRLSDNIRAQLEPVSGLLVVDVDTATYGEAFVNWALGTPKEKDLELILAINHETYHYFQTIATGYQYQYVSEMWRTAVKEGKRQTYRQWRRRWSDWWLQKAFPIFKWRSDNKGDYARAMILFRGVAKKLDPAHKSKKEDIELIKKNIMGIAAVAGKSFQANQWVRDALEREKDGRPRDVSVVGAQMPSLAQSFKKLWDGVNTPNSDGLSAMDLIEGSAIIYEYALTYGRNGLADRLPSVWEAHGDTYRKAYEVAQKECGARALDIILPAVALALRYSNPPNAYQVFLKTLKSLSQGSEVSEARALADRPPRIPSAGRYLGTALDVWKRQRYWWSRYRIYDDVLNSLEKRAWGVDEIDLLAEPRTSEKVKSFPLLIVTKDGPLAAKLDGSRLNVGELGSRLKLGSLVLRTAMLFRYRREADQLFRDRLHASSIGILDPLQAGNEYGHLGLVYLDRGDLDQAEVMFELALVKYESLVNKEGMARVYYNLGELCARRKDLNRAEEMYRKSLAIFEALEDREMIARASGNLGVVYFTREDWGQAEAMIRRAMAIEEALGLKGIEIEYFNLGRICRARGDWVKADELLSKALMLHEEAGNGLMARSVQEELAELRKARTDR
ncbi:MAG TPA: tetratricopeptide repeat protein [Methylocella sp.]|nr:tetratricopeptide repeat protein [Methylocella sp.]